MVNFALASYCHNIAKKYSVNFEKSYDKEKFCGRLAKI